MTDAGRPLLVVEDDPFPRILEVLLDPDVSSDRAAAFTRLMEPECPDFAKWCARMRKVARGLYPARVRLVSSQDELRAALPDATAAMVESLEFGREEVERAPAIRAVQKYGTITRNIDLAACEARGIPVLTLKRRVNVACAEHALGLMLALAKKITRVAGRISPERLAEAGFRPASYDRTHTPTSAWAGVTGLSLLNGTTLGILGMGEIGRVLAPRAAGLGMKVIYFQRTRLAPAEERRFKVRYAPLDTLLAVADWISLHLPETPETRGFIGAPQLARMKRGARIVNVARARLVDRAALIEALRSGHLGGYGLDALYEEPGRADDELLGFDNVILTPHIAGQFRTSSLLDYEDLLRGLSRAIRRDR
jgi:phosphoglycerate dehydrogenase-like enzyme